MTVPAGWRATLPISMSAEVIFNATAEVIFAIQRLGNLRVFKYEDSDGDGQQDAGEGPVQGITVTVRFPSGMTEAKLTAADGYISWNAIPVGSYRVTETLTARWRAILPASVSAEVLFNATTDVTFANQRRDVQTLSAARMAISAATTHAHSDPDKYAISHSDPSAHAHTGSYASTDRHPRPATPEGNRGGPAHPPALRGQPQHACCV